MKKRKLLILLAAVLSFTLLLTSCDLFADQNAAETTGNDAENSAKPFDGIGAEAIDHEIRKYFDLKSSIEAKKWTGVSRIDGEIVDYDEDHDLIAVKTLDLNNDNYVEEKIKVYDLNTEEVFLADVVRNEYGTDPADKTVLKVDIDYPVIRVSREYRSEGSTLDYEVKYYLVGSTNEYFHYTSNNDYEMNRYKNGLVSCKAGDKVFWIDKDLKIIRTVDAIIANGYNVDSFMAEYQGYLYAFDGEYLQIFNRSGMCCVYQKFEGLNKNAYVLDNGNVLVQVQNFLDDLSEPCDVIFEGNRIAVDSYVVSFTDGTVNEVELDYFVYDLTSAYADNTAPLQLAQGRHNQAIISKFVNKQAALKQEYVVLNNDLTIEYSLKNDTPGFSPTMIEVLNANFYKSYVFSGGTVSIYIFDLDGNPVAVSNTFFTNTKYIMSTDCIYDYSMKPVYNIKANGFEMIDYDSASDNVYLSKFNFKTGADEVYLFNGKTAAPVLLADGIDAEFDGSDYGVYAVDTDDVVTIYAADGTALLVVKYGFNDIELNDFAVIETKFEGKSINYILK